MNNPVNEIFDKSAIFRTPDDWNNLHEYLANEDWMRHIHGKQGNMQYRLMRVLIVGCSKGQDAISTAMMLRHNGLVAKIDAIDINPNHIKAANEGEYPIADEPFIAEPSFDWTKEWYTVKNEKIRICDEILEMIDYKIADIRTFSCETKYDLIVFRNVAGYFNESEQKEIMDKIDGMFYDFGVFFYGEPERRLRPKTTQGWFKYTHLPYVSTRIRSTSFTDNFEPGKKFNKTLIFGGNGSFDVSISLLMGFVLPPKTRILFIDADICPLIWMPNIRGKDCFFDVTKVYFGFDLFHGLGFYPFGKSDEDVKNMHLKMRNEYLKHKEDFDRIFNDSEEIYYIAIAERLGAELLRLWPDKPNMTILGARWVKPKDDNPDWHSSEELADNLVKELGIKEDKIKIITTKRDDQIEYDKYFDLREKTMVDTLANLIGATPKNKDEESLSLS